MEVKFNGKTISIGDITNEIFDTYATRAVKKTPSSDIDKPFKQAYSDLLTARLGGQSIGSPSNKTAGIASERLLESIRIQKISNKAIKQSENKFVIQVNQEESFNKYGLIIGEENSFKSGFNAIAIQKMKQWIRFKKSNGGSFDYSKVNPREKDEDKALARMILWSWSKKGKDRRVLPKWYSIFKDGDKEALKYLFMNRKELETSLKNILDV